MNAEETTEVVVAETPEAPKAEAPEVATEKPEAPEAEAKPEGEDKADRDEKGRFKGVQPRIDELTKARREAEREAAYWRQMAQQAQAPKAQEPEKPTPDKYTDYGEYVEALTDFKAAQAAEKAAARLLSDRAQASQRETVQSTWQERAADVRAKIADFDDVVGQADTPAARHVQETLLESDKGPELLYHLAKNPDVLLRLNTMSERQAARELGKIEALLAATTVTAPAKLTQAPKPASVSQPIGSAATSKDPSKMSVEEYMAFRKGQKARWSR